jgi:hypothetical protein
MEANMTGILDKFYVDHSAQGAKVMTRTLQLTAGCASDAEVEASIQMLKDDLEACEREMKRLLTVNRSGSLFEGWPSPADDVLQEQMH